MKLSCPAFAQGKEIPSKYTCEGLGCNPELHISDVLPNAETLALILEDPDIPNPERVGGIFVHWVVFNIPKGTTRIKENARPPGVEGVNTLGTPGYYGPCPPDRRHRYYFRLYALDTSLNLKAGATRADLLKAMEGHVIDKTELMGTYDKHHTGEN